MERLTLQDWFKLIGAFVAVYGAWTMLRQRGVL